MLLGVGKYLVCISIPCLQRSLNSSSMNSKQIQVAPARVDKKNALSLCTAVIIASCGWGLTVFYENDHCLINNYITLSGQYHLYFRSCLYYLFYF